MATNSSGTVDISVYVTLDKEDDRNILSFIVQDEYHLKKLAVGAYNLNILDTQIIAQFHDWKQHSVVAHGDYVILSNFNVYKNLNVILFNIKPTVLKKGNCIFNIIFYNTDKILQKTDSIDTTPEKNTCNTSCNTTDFSIETTKSQLRQTENSKLFNKTFSENNKESEDDDDDDEEEESSESSVEDNLIDKNGNSTFYIEKRTTADENDGELASKRQKLDD